MFATFLVFWPAYPYSSRHCCFGANGVSDIEIAQRLRQQSCYCFPLERGSWTKFARLPLCAAVLVQVSGMWWFGAANIRDATEPWQPIHLQCLFPLTNKCPLFCLLQDCLILADCCLPGVFVVTQGS